MKNERIKRRPVTKIPPPPDLEAGYDAIIAYHMKYSMEELEEAGYLEEPSAEEVEELATSGTYHWLCKYGLHLKLSKGDYAKLSVLAAQKDIAVEKLVRRWIKNQLRVEQSIPERSLARR